jgi:hypothetical protein
MVCPHFGNYILQASIDTGKKAFFFTFKEKGGFSTVYLAVAFGQIPVNKGNRASYINYGV